MGTITTLKDFLIDGVRQKLLKKTALPSPNNPWMRAFGSLRDLHRESKRVDRVVQREFERIDEDERR